MLLVVAAQGADLAPDQLIAQGHWKRARAMVVEQWNAVPDGAELNFLLSQIRAAFGDRTAPGPLAERAVKLAPGIARYHRQLAEVQGVMAQHANAFQQLFLARRFRKELDTALELDPRDTQALRDLVELYLLAPGLVGGDISKAEETALRIGAVDRSEGLSAQARVAEFRKQFRVAGEWFGKAAEISPGSYKAAIEAARYWMAPEHQDESAAEKYARRALVIDPGRSEAWAVLASIDAGRRDWDGLARVLSGAAEAVPDDAVPFYRAAERLAADGIERERAVRYLTHYLSLEPEGNQATEADARRLLEQLRKKGRS